MQAAPSARWYSWLTLVVSGIGALTALGFSALLLFSGGIGLLGETLPATNGISVLNLGWASALVALLCVPGLVFSILELRGRSLVERHGRRNLILAILAALVWIGLVFLFKPLETSKLAWLLLPPLVVITTVIPLWFYLEIGRGGLSSGSQARTWGMVSFSLVVTLPVIMLLEIILLFVVLVAAGVYFSTQPDLALELERYARIFSNFNANPEVLERAFADLFRRPGVIAVTLALAAGAIPLLEELFKPLAVWLLAGQRLTPAQGYVAGMVSGACFALYENLTALSAAGGGNGTTILLARVGTGLLHIVTAGMVGWGLTSAWRERKGVKRLATAFLLAVLLHASWNSAGVLAGVATFLPVPAEPTPLSTGMTQTASIILYVLLFVNLFLLVYMNIRLRRENAAQEIAVIPAEPAASAPGENLP